MAFAKMDTSINPIYRTSTSSTPSSDAHVYLNTLRSSGWTLLVSVTLNRVNKSVQISISLLFLFAGLVMLFPMGGQGSLLLSKGEESTLPPCGTGRLSLYQQLKAMEELKLEGIFYLNSSQWTFWIAKHKVQPTHGANPKWLRVHRVTPDEVTFSLVPEKHGQWKNLKHALKNHPCFHPHACTLKPGESFGNRKKTVNMLPVHQKKKE